MPEIPRINPEVFAWLEKRDLNPPAGEHPDWGFKIGFSTVAVSDWTIRRSHIGPQELWFGLGLSRILGWRATLFPRDESFRVSWRSDGTPEVTAQSLALRRRPWPSLLSLDELPELLGAIEALLGRQFLRGAEFSAASLKTGDFLGLADWLRPACDTMEVFLGTLHGELPQGAQITEGDATQGGIRLSWTLAKVENPRDAARS